MTARKPSLLPNTTCNTNIPPPSTNGFASTEERNRWEAVVAVVVTSFKLAKGRAVLDGCRGRGLSIEAVERVVDFWRSHSHEFDGVGALGCALERIEPGQLAEDAFPQRNRRPAPVSTDDALRREFAELSGMGDEDLEKLLAQAFPAGSTLRQLWLLGGRNETSLRALARHRSIGRRAS